MTALSGHEPQIKISIPAAASRLLGALRRAGFEAYVVGGCVRDSLLGRTPGDWDICTSARPEQVRTVFSAYRQILTGEKHGTVAVIVGGTPYEITTYRVDGQYHDSRHPDAVQFVPQVQPDLARRDFTINAMAYNEAEGLVDPFGGQKDLQNGLLRAVGEPQQRFTEDALRILRLYRFAARFGFALDAATARAARQLAPHLDCISAERIQEELAKLLTAPQPGAYLEPAVLAVVLPELTPAALDAAKPVVDACPAGEKNLPVRWAALLHDVGKPPCFSLGPDGVGHFYGHAAKSTELAEGILTRLRFDTAGRTRIMQLIRYHDLPIAPEAKPIRRLMNKLGVETVRQLFELHIADTCGQSAICAGRVETYRQAERVLDELLAADACFSLKDLAVNGDDLLALGLRGRAVGAALQACLDAVMDETLPNDRAALLGYAAENLQRFANS